MKNTKFLGSISLPKHVSDALASYEVENDYVNRFAVFQAYNALEKLVRKHPDLLDWDTVQPHIKEVYACYSYFSSCTDANYIATWQEDQYEDISGFGDILTSTDDCFSACVIVNDRMQVVEDPSEACVPYFMMELYSDGYDYELRIIVQYKW